MFTRKEWRWERETYASISHSWHLHMNVDHSCLEYSPVVLTDLYLSVDGSDTMDTNEGNSHDHTTAESEEEVYS